MGVKTPLSPGSGSGILWLMRFGGSITIQSPGYIMGFSVKNIFMMYLLVFYYKNLSYGLSFGSDHTWSGFLFFS